MTHDNKPWGARSLNLYKLQETTVAVSSGHCARGAEILVAILARPSSTEDCRMLFLEEVEGLGQAHGPIPQL